MGFRTVVMLSNDHTQEWSNDLLLGRKISQAMNYTFGDQDSCIANYGRVVECVHADTQTLAMLDGYTAFRPLAHTGWRAGLNTDEAAVAALKDAADKLGYRLVRKSK